MTSSGIRLSSAQMRLQARNILLRLSKTEQTLAVAARDAGYRMPINGHKLGDGSSLKERLSAF